MDSIFDVLRLEHADVRDLVNRLITLTSIEDRDQNQQAQMIENATEDWAELFLDLKVNLVAHNRAEEAVFYALLHRVSGKAELADLKTEEHHLAEELLEDLEEINPDDFEWGTKLALLKNQIEAHVAEEEGMVFGILQPAVSDEDNRHMIREFVRIRDDIMQTLQYQPKGRSIVNPAGLDLDRNR